MLTPGGQGSCTIVCQNKGRVDAVNIQVIVVLPAGMFFNADRSPAGWELVSSDAQTASLQGTQEQTYRYIVEELEAGQSTSVDIGTNIDSSASIGEGMTLRSYIVDQDGGIVDDDGADQSASILVGYHQVYLPMVAQYGTGAVQDNRPDLVASIKLSPEKSSFTAGEPVQIEVTVTNNGGVPTGGGFWVDLFINPSSIPDNSNSSWQQMCGIDPCYGIAWKVEQSLAAGESIVLTSTADSFDADATTWKGWFASGTTDVYAYVDSWGSQYGDISEANEKNNLAALHGLSVTGSNP
jgi:uncharacterized repeat protein (TIGR01451 family)